MRLATLPSFRRCVSGLSDERLGQVWDTMRKAGDTYGHPHLHAGIGMRRLRKGIMECRDALDNRLVFKIDGDTLLFVLYGTHDDVRAFLKNRR